MSSSSHMHKDLEMCISNKNSSPLSDRYPGKTEGKGDGLGSLLIDMHIGAMWLILEANQAQTS